MKSLQRKFYQSIYPFDMKDVIFMCIMGLSKILIFLGYFYFGYTLSRLYPHLALVLVVLVIWQLVHNYVVKVWAEERIKQIK